MPKIRAVSTSVPATRIDQSEAEAFARLKFADRIPDLERLMPLFSHSGIATRYFAAPREWFFTAHDMMLL